MTFPARLTPADKSNDATGGILSVDETAGSSFLGFTTAGGDRDRVGDGDFNGDDDGDGDGEGEIGGAKIARGRSTLSMR